jgi:hypothetical protein
MQVIHYFPDTHLGRGHNGLRAIAKRHRKDISNLEDGQFALFINVARTAFKMFAAGNIIVHHKTPDNSVISPQTIRLLPKYFNGGQLDFRGALAEAVEKDFERWSKR